MSKYKEDYTDIQLNGVHCELKGIGASKDTREIEVYEYVHNETGAILLRVEVPTYAPTSLINELLLQTTLCIPER